MKTCAALNNRHWERIQSPRCRIDCRERGRGRLTWGFASRPFLTTRLVITPRLIVTTRLIITTGLLITAGLIIPPTGGCPSVTTGMARRGLRGRRCGLSVTAGATLRLPARCLKRG